MTIMVIISPIENASFGIDLSRIPLQWENIKNEVEAWVGNFIQITVLSTQASTCAFVYRNAAKVYKY